MFFSLSFLISFRPSFFFLFPISFSLFFFLFQEDVSGFDTFSFENLKTTHRIRMFQIARVFRLLQRAGMKRFKDRFGYRPKTKTVDQCQGKTAGKEWPITGRISLKLRLISFHHSICAGGQGPKRDQG